MIFRRYFLFKHLLNKRHKLANTIIDNFNDYFEILPAISDELKIEVYKLRYQIYCIENDFLNSEDYPDNLEFDNFDRHSIHYLIRHRKSGDFVATTRLILPDANNPEKFFPLELNCKIDNIAVMQSIERKHLGEVSRLCVSKAFKKRKNEAQSLAPLGSECSLYFTPEEQRSFPIICLALIACSIKAGYDNGLHYSFAATDSPLLHFISALGINAIEIGPMTNYHGNRWPVLIKAKDFNIAQMKKAGIFEIHSLMITS